MGNMFQRLITFFKHGFEIFQVTVSQDDSVTKEKHLRKNVGKKTFVFIVKRPSQSKNPSKAQNCSLVF